MGLLVAYAERITPGLGLGVLLLLWLPRDRIELRLVVYILLFILVRDAMTPLGLWHLDRAGWLRLPADAVQLWALALATVGAITAVNLLEPKLRDLLVWRRGGFGRVLALGLGGGGLVAAPSFLWHHGVPIESRGGAVAIGLLAPLLVFSLIGNLLEEILFRGYFQGYLERLAVAPARIVLLSGLLFAFCHVFLASTVTDGGSIILLFTLYEGLIAALARQQGGVVAAAIAHGLGIFLISSGLT